MSSFFLVRHGETRLSGRYCGSSNPRLNERGRSQAKAAAKSLGRFSMDVCFVSPQLRAQQTAQLIRRRVDVPWKTSPLLREINFGAWEGLRFQDVETKWPHLAKRWSIDPTSVRIPSAETFGALRRRVKRFLASLRKTQPA